MQAQVIKLSVTKGIEVNNLLRRKLLNKEFEKNKDCKLFKEKNKEIENYKRYIITLDKKSQPKFMLVLNNKNTSPLKKVKERAMD